MVDTAYYQELLRPLFQRRRIVLVGMVLAGATPMVEMLRRLGSDRILVVADGRGTGPIPSSEDAEWIIVEHRAPDVVTELREIGRLVAAPPGNVMKAVEAYDPDGRALVIPPIITLGPMPDSMAGRQVWGGRPRASFALEDKTTVDAFWDRLGIRRAPSLLAPSSIDALVGAHRQMNRGAGTVIAGDSLEGPHGGAHLVRWIQNEEQLTRGIELFAQHCARVRVMPFLEGIPCSIHGLVFEAGSVVLRPVELMTLRPAGGFTFLYAGAATFWDPPEEDRRYMRSVARTVCDAYREQVGTGCFTIDGVLTTDGWLPTELNPRFGAGISVMARGLPDFPLILLCQALQAGEALEYRPDELEAWLISAADAHRHGGGWTTFAKQQDENQEHRLVHAGHGYRLAGEVEAADGVLSIGPSNVGGFVRFIAEPARTPAGPSIAPSVVSAFALADREFGTGLGALNAAYNVRR